MNAGEWYAEIKKHTGGMVAFACDVLADRDSQIAGLCTRVDELVVRVNEVNREKAEKDAAIRVLDACLVENRRLRAEQTCEIESLLASRARDKLRIVNQRNDIESLNRVLAETREKLVAATLRKHQRDSLDAMIYSFVPPAFVFTSEPAQQQLGSKAQKQSDVYTCYAQNVWGEQLGSKARVWHAVKSDSETEAAEEVARETESLAHRIEYIEKKVWGDANPDLGGTILGRIENNFQADLRRHKRTRDIAEENLKPVVARIETLENGRWHDNKTVVEKLLDGANATKKLEREHGQYSAYVRERLDNQTEKLKELDGHVKHARQSRARMHKQIEDLEQTSANMAGDIDDKYVRLQVWAQSADQRIAALEANIVDVRKVAEGDRVDVRRLANRINKAGIPPL